MPKPSLTDPAGLPTRATFAAAIVLGLISGYAVASPFHFTSTASGDWTDTGGWSSDPAGGTFPQADDSVTLGHAKTVSSDQEFGGATQPETSVWSAGNLTVNGGFSHTHRTGGNLDFTGGDTKILGGGTFINAGTFDHQTGSRMDLDGAGVTFLNSGTYIYSHTTGTRQLSLRANTQFVNTGTLIVNSTVNTRFELSSTDNRFFNDGGTIQVNTANLVIDEVEFTAGAGSQFEIADGRMIQINDKVRDEIRGAVDPTFGNGKLVINGNVNVVSGTLTLDVTGGGGVTYQGDAWDLTGGSGADVTNLGRFTHETTNRVRIDNYSFTNEAGAVYHYEAGGGTNILASPLDGNGIFRNRGLLHIDGTSTAARIEGSGLFHADGGTVLVEPGRNLLLESRVRAEAGSEFDVGAGAEVRITGDVSDRLVTTATGDGELVLAGTGLDYTGGNTVLVFDVGGNGLITRTGTGTGGRLGNGSNAVENHGILILDQSGGRFGTSGSGTFTNFGTMVIREGDRYDFGNDAFFVNEAGGFVDVSGHSSDVALTLRNAGGFDNRGTFLKDSTQTGRIEGGSTTADNTGVFEVRQGSLRVQRPVLQNATSTLTAGTWNVLDGGTLTFENSANNIMTIGTDATVRLGNAATFDRVDTVQTVEGTFGLWDARVFTTAGNLATPGILEFGLGEFLDTGAGYDDRTLLDIAGDADFTDGLVFIEDRGISEGIYRIIEWTGDRTGELSLANFGVGNLEWSLDFADTTSGFYNLIVTEVTPTDPPVGVIPEPSSVVLALSGLVMLVRWRRRRGVR